MQNISYIDPIDFKVKQQLVNQSAGTFKQATIAKLG